MSVERAMVIEWDPCRGYACLLVQSTTRIGPEWWPWLGNGAVPPPAGEVVARDTEAALGRIRAGLARIAASNPHAGRVRCLRCGGPAGYLGLACEREGGCKTAEERAAAMEPVNIRRIWTAPYYCEAHFVAESDGIRVEHPTREGALAAWRAALAETLR